MEKYGFVYLWRDRKHNRYYIGCHWGTEDDGYVCSSTWMRNARKRRPSDFKRRILSRVYTNRKDLIDEEYRWLQMTRPNELKIRYYNLNRHHNGHWSSEEERAKTLRKRISKKTKEAMWRDDVRKNYFKGLDTRDNRSSDLEVRKKRSISLKNRIQNLTEEERRLRTAGWKKAQLKAVIGSKRLYKDDSYKLAQPNSDKWNKLISDGWIEHK